MVPMPDAGKLELGGHLFSRRDGNIGLGLDWNCKGAIHFLMCDSVSVVQLFPLSGLSLFLVERHTNLDVSSRLSIRSM